MTRLPDILTTEQVADLHGVTPRAVRWAIQHGQLAALRVGGSWVVTRAAAQAWERRPIGRPKKVPAD